MIRTWHLLILVGALAACGSSGNGSDPTAWVGNWNTVGRQSTTCSGATDTTQLTGLTVIAVGTKASTIQTTATITGTNTGSTNNGCSFMQPYTLTKM